MKVGSLFSGIGGLDLGLERNGMDIRWQCEIDTAAQSVLRRHWPDAVLYDDVTKLGGDIERVDLVCGGFPCQDLSVAGKRAGLAGSRSGLFHEFMRIASKLAPRWVLIENVPGLLSSNGGRDMGALLGTLGNLGYGWAYRVLDAQYFGVAQRRRRVFIVGCLGDAASAASVLFEPESCNGDTAPRREAGMRVTQSLTGGPGSSSCGNPDDNRAQGGFLTVAPALVSRYAKGTDSDATDALIAHTLRAEGSDASEDGSGRGVSLVCAVRMREGCEGGGKGPLVSEERSLTLATANDQILSFEPGSIARNAGPAGESPLAPTLRSDMGDNQPAVRAGMAVRRLTPTECERLQGFPDGWTDGQSDSTRYRQLGNAVCVPVAEWIGKRIMEAAA